MGTYRRRIVDDYFQMRLRSAGALLIEGPKWCGKTSTGENLAASALYMQDPDYRDEYINKANSKPSLLLEGDNPRLIDEWQVAPKIWDAVRFAVDKRQSRGLFILTGSTVPCIDKDALKLMHTGAGRIARTRMRTMSLFESGDSSGEVSLRELFEGNDEYYCRSDMTIERIAYLVCRGGWPSNFDLDEKEALITAKDYLQSIISSDIIRVDGVKRNAVLSKALLHSLSRNICTLADTPTIMKDLPDSADRKTIANYIDALKEIFVVEDIPTWTPALMSKARLRMSPKRNLADPSIAAAALSASPERLVADAPSLGSLFESLCIRDLRVYSQVLEGTVYHYHDNTGLEVDAIVELDDGRWGAIEIKLFGGVEKAADNLKRMCSKTVLKSGIGPSFMAVLVGNGFFMKRDDGVIVVPIGCLKD